MVAACTVPMMPTWALQVQLAHASSPPRMKLVVGSHLGGLGLRQLWWRQPARVAEHRMRPTSRRGNALDRDCAADSRLTAKPPPEAQRFAHVPDRSSGSADSRSQPEERDAVPAAGALSVVARRGEDARCGELPDDCSRALDPDLVAELARDRLEGQFRQGEAVGRLLGFYGEHARSRQRSDDLPAELAVAVGGRLLLGWAEVQAHRAVMDDVREHAVEVRCGRVRRRAHVEPRAAGGLHIQDDRDWSVVNDLDDHPSAQHPGFDRHAKIAERLTRLLAPPP
jgi:hypothetical protein